MGFYPLYNWHFSNLLVSEQTPPRGTKFEGESRKEQGEGIKSLYDHCSKGPLENAARSSNVTDQIRLKERQKHCQVS